MRRLLTITKPPLSRWLLGTSAMLLLVIAVGCLQDKLATAPEVPTAEAVVLSPASASLQVGATQQFDATVQMSDGTSQDGTMTWAATGGTVSSAGLYTAGSTAGSFRVIATYADADLADTAAITLTTTPPPPPPPPPVLDGVVVTPPSASLQGGATQQFSAAGHMSDGSSSTVSVTWVATGGTINASGLYTAGSTAGSFRVIGTQTGGTFADTSDITITVAPPPPPPPNGTTGDPTQLPVANHQIPDFAAYTGRSLAAGQSYNDPATGVRVWKVTSATSPVANGEATHDYSSGAVQISRAWGGNKHTVLAQFGGTHRLVDFTPGAGFTNWRSAPPTLNTDLCFTFSYNPATPQIAYYTAGNVLRRYNAATNADAPSGFFPKSFAAQTAGDLIWLHQDKNDEWFVVMPTDASRIIAWNSVTNQTLVMTGARMGIPLNEPHLERDGRYVMMSLEQYGHFGVWDLQTDTFWIVLRPENHPAAIRSFLVANDPDPNDGPQYRYDFGTKTMTDVLSASHLTPDLQHHSDQWVQSDAELGGDLRRQWVLVSSYNEGLVSPSGGWTLDAGEVYRTAPNWTPTYEKPQIGVQSARQIVTGDATRMDRQLTKAASRAAMTEGSFFWDAAANRVYVWAVGGGTPLNRVILRAPGNIHDAIGFFRADGSDVRILAHHYSVGSPGYWQTPRATVSPDGSIVVFASNMNDSDGRGDMFLIEVPAK